jgi:hypothetical protein
MALSDSGKVKLPVGAASGKSFGGHALPAHTIAVYERQISRKNCTMPRRQAIRRRDRSQESGTNFSITIAP